MPEPDAVSFEAGFALGWDTLAKALKNKELKVEDLDETLIDPIGLMVAFHRWSEQVKKEGA